MAYTRSESPLVSSPGSNDVFIPMPRERLIGDEFTIDNRMPRLISSKPPTPPPPFAGGDARNSGRRYPPQPSNRSFCLTKSSRPNFNSSTRSYNVMTPLASATINDDHVTFVNSKSATPGQSNSDIGKQLDETVRLTGTSAKTGTLNGGERVSVLVREAASRSVIETKRKSTLKLAVVAAIIGYCCPILAGIALFHATKPGFSSLDRAKSRRFAWLAIVLGFFTMLAVVGGIAGLSLHLAGIVGSRRA